MPYDEARTEYESPLLDSGRKKAIIKSDSIKNTSIFISLISASVLTLSVTYDYGYLLRLGISFAEAPTTLADHIRSSLVWFPYVLIIFFSTLAFELLTRRIEQYDYPKKRLAFEYSVNFGREKKSVDIVIFDKDRTDTAYIIVELKKLKLKDGKDQLRSYCNATGAPIGVWTNGEQISHYHRKDPNYFEDITDIPKARQSLKDILSECFTLKDLIVKDKISNERKSLKNIILEMEDVVLANAGVDVFEEVFKLIFTKLYDEYLSQKRRKQAIQLRYSDG